MEKETATAFQTTASLADEPILHLIRRLLADPEAGPRDVAAAARLDPELEARLIRVANSPRLGRRHAVRSVREAVVHLGMEGVRRVLSRL
jgi:HD-like signal output (HDOD) protein